MSNKIRIVFNRAQIEYLESIYGTYRDMAMNISKDTDMKDILINVGRQEVLETIRKLQGGIL